MIRPIEPLSARSLLYQYTYFCISVKIAGQRRERRSIRSLQCSGGAASSTIQQQHVRRSWYQRAGSGVCLCQSDMANFGTSGSPPAYNRVMRMQVNAVYQNGSLKPLQPLNLAENEHVVVTITQAASALGFSQLDTKYIEGLRRKLAGAELAPGLEEVRRRLSKIPGSMAADFIAEREDR